MNRLTQKFNDGYSLILNNPQNTEEAREQLMKQFKLAVEKLAQVEDLLQSYGYESMDELFEFVTNKINNLQQQLAEKDKEIERLQSELSGKVDYIHELVEVKDDYKQQLAEKEKEIEDLKNQLKGACQKYHAKCEYLQQQLKDQSKTEFAIQQLERVKEKIDKSGYELLEPLWVQFVVINQIINELKGEDK